MLLYGSLFMIKCVGILIPFKGALQELVGGEGLI